MTEFIKDFWYGYITYGPFTAPGSFWIYVDAAVSILVLFFVLQFFNTLKGWRYIGSLAFSALLLVISGLFNLDSLRTLIQVVLIAHVIGLPVIFKAEWSNLLVSKSDEVIGYFKKPVIAIISIIVGLIITLLSAGVTTKTAEFPQAIPIQLSNLAEGISGDVGSQNTVKVIIRAPKSVWQSLTADTFSAYIDTAKREEGTYDLSLQVTSKLSSVEILKTNPSTIIVSLQPVIKKTVSVGVKVTGKPGNNLVTDVSTTNPDKVEITGAKSVINDIASVTAVISVEAEVKSPVVKKVPLQALDSAGQVIPGVTISQNEAEVTVPLINSGSQKAVGISPDITGSPAIGYWVSGVNVTPAVVQITGSADRVNETIEIKTSPISVTGFSSNKTVKVSLIVPSGITVLNLSDNTVSVQLVLSALQSTKQITPLIEYSGLASNLKVTALDPTSVSAIVRGESSKLNSLKESDIKLKLNLSSYQSQGTYTVNIISSDFQLIEGVSLTSFLPSAISVTLNNK